MKLKSIKSVLLGSSAVLVLAFQNCSENQIQFSSATVLDKFGNIPCVNFSAQSEGSCLSSKNGLLGKLFYLKTHVQENGSILVSTATDPNNLMALNVQNVPNSQFIIDHGHRHSSYILMPTVSVPTMSFITGFVMDNGEVLRDNEGTKLEEAFALDLRGYLLLPQGFEEGFYQVAVLADDGFSLSLSSSRNGNYDVSVVSEGFQSPTVRCSATALYLKSGYGIPMKLTYYQGPRTAVALTMLMRKVSQEHGLDNQTCKHTDGGTSYLFGGKLSDPGYVPDYVNGVYGQKLIGEQGWKAIPRDGYGLPDVIN